MKKCVILWGIILCAVVLGGCQQDHNSEVGGDLPESQGDECAVSVDFTTITDFLSYIDNPEEQRRGYEMSRAAYLDFSEMLLDAKSVYTVILGEDYYKNFFDDDQGVKGIGFRVMLLENGCDPSEEYDELRQKEGVYTQFNTLDEAATLNSDISGGFTYYHNGQEFVYIVYQGEIRCCSFSIGNYYVEVTSFDRPSGPYQQAIVDALLDKKNSRTSWPSSPPSAKRQDKEKSHPAGWLKFLKSFTLPPPNTLSVSRRNFPVLRN